MPAADSAPASRPSSKPPLAKPASIRCRTPPLSPAASSAKKKPSSSSSASGSPAPSPTAEKPTTSTAATSAPPRWNSPPAAATLVNKGQRPHTRFIRTISHEDKNLFTHQSSPYPAFAAYAVVDLPDEVYGYSPGNLDFWHLTFKKDTITLFWIGYGDPKPLKLTDDLIDLCRQAAY